MFVRRWYWNTGEVGDGAGYSSKLSVKVILGDLRAWYVGLRVVETGPFHTIVKLQLVPVLLGLRLHLARSYGGRYI